MIVLEVIVIALSHHELQRQEVFSCVLCMLKKILFERHSKATPFLVFITSHVLVIKCSLAVIINIILTGALPHL